MQNEIIIKKKQTSSFSVKARLKSMLHAVNGLHDVLSHQPNSIVHLFLTIIAYGAAIFFRVSWTELIAITLAATLVWAAELFNTSIEKLADLISLESRPEIKTIKDISAGAVLICAVGAAITGAIIFIPKILA